MKRIDAVNKMLDEFIGHVQSHFKAFVVSHTCHVLGSDVLNMLGDDVQVTKTVGLHIAIEPVAVWELRQFREVYPGFIVDVFHGKLVQLWQNLLNRVFAHYVDLHLSGQRIFSELGNRSVKVDFRQAAPMADQVRESLCHGFAFERFANRQKLVARLRNSGEDMEGHATVILQHIHIRNAIQHHDGVLNDFVLRELGVTELRLLDESASDHVFTKGDKIVLSVPELDRFRRALLVVAQTWKT